jgi:hypothetical protein
MRHLFVKDFPQAFEIAEEHQRITFMDSCMMFCRNRNPFFASLYSQDNNILTAKSLFR